MRKTTPFSIFCGCFLAVSLHAAKPSFAPVTNRPAAANAAAEQRFSFREADGRSVSVAVADASARRKLKLPAAKVDPKMNPVMLRAATIAQDRAHARSKSRCWRYVKQALLAAGAVKSYPKTALAKQAAAELVQNHGFKKLPVKDPYAAPVGAVLVYGGKGAGHIEIRNKTGFVSDFRAAVPSKRKLIGVFAKA